MKLETQQETKNRVLDLAENVDCGILSPPMEAQTAFNEIKRFVLGEDFYITSAVPAKQANTEILYYIERALRWWKFFHPNNK